ncbi:MAG: C40 family peptidase [Lachnospiraceae bacterium]|nr:C40 family peptidase [Lachnospiraceae bacterium]MBP3506261.1 C40 family peptidase [Lachnospiraceae bacterium]
MIRKMMRNTLIIAAGISMVLALGTPSKAEETYKDTAVAGIDAAIDQYVATMSANQVSEAGIATDTSAVSEEPATEVATEAVVPESTARYPEFENKLMANVTDYMNIRSEADANSEAVGKLPHGAVAEVLERGEEWTKIQSGSVTGYVKNEYVVFGDDAGDYAEENCHKIATVTTTTLKVREEASAESICLTMIPEGETYEVVETADGWTKLLISEEFTGYVSNEFITIEFDLGTAISKEEEEAERARQEELARQAAQAAQAAQQSQQATSNPAPQAPAQVPSVDTSAVSGTRADLVNYALQFVGNPYVYGGSSLTSGTDCSGFTMRVYEHFGYSLYRSSRDQIKNGTNIGIYEVQPGDLLFYNNGGSTIGHVAIYIGDGKIVHASTPRTGIIVSNAYYQTPCGATRILP